MCRGRLAGMRSLGSWKLVIEGPPARVRRDYFGRLGHDNHRRLSKLYAWEEKKSKTSWSAQTVDYEKIAAASAQAMSPADLRRFLVVCALGVRLRIHLQFQLNSLETKYRGGRVCY